MRHSSTTLPTHGFMLHPPPPALIWYLQGFRSEEIRAEGLHYPPPASRFGVGDSVPSRTAGPAFGAVGESCSLDGLHPKRHSPYFAHPDQEGYVGRCESRQPRRLALDEENICDDRAGTHRLGSNAGSLHVLPTSRVYDELTVADNGNIRLEDGVLTGKAQKPCGYMQDGGWAAETPGTRSQTADWRRPHRPPSLERENSPHLDRIDGRGWLRHLPRVAQEILSGEELNQGESSVAQGGNVASLSSLFAYAFADDKRHQGWLPESTRESSRGGGGGGYARSVCSGVVRAEWSSPQNPSSLPPLLPGGGATMKEKNPVGITVRRPPSPQFSFMTADCSLDAITSPATSPKHRTHENVQQREVQGASCLDGMGARICGASQHQDGSGIPLDDYAEIPASPAVDKAGSLSGDADLMADEEMRSPALSRKRKHPAAREAVGPRESHHSTSTGYNGASCTSEDGAMLGSRRRRGHRWNGWWGANVGDMSPFVCNLAAVGASGLEVNDVSFEKGDHMIRKHVKARVATARRYEPATAGDSARFATEASKRNMMRNETAAAVAGDGEMSHVEGDRRKGGGSGRAALAYDEDVLGGEGAAETGVGNFEPETVAGVLAKIRCDDHRGETLKLFGWFTTEHLQNPTRPCVCRSNCCVSPRWSYVCELAILSLPKPLARNAFDTVVMPLCSITTRCSCSRAPLRPVLCELLPL